MINSHKSNRHIQWSIIAGTVLLFIAFFIIITSKNNDTTQENSTTTIRESATTSKHTEISTSQKVTEIPTEEPTTKISKDSINFNVEYPYLIRINRAENFAVIYGADEKGRHSIPYKAFICSTGSKPEYTPLGVFEMSDKYLWRLMVDYTYAQYAIRIDGQIMLHSVPYIEASNDTLESWEYNKLGKPASLGCIRFRVGAIKWIYNNCEKGTKVNIYSKPGEIPPIAIPKLKKIKRSDPKSGWDPTDPAAGNPWKSKKNRSHKSGK